MPNYWLGATGRYYFPGLYTAVLPMIPGIWAIVRILRANRSEAQVAGRNDALAPQIAKNANPTTASASASG